MKVNIVNYNQRINPNVTVFRNEKTASVIKNSQDVFVTGEKKPVTNKNTVYVLFALAVAGLGAIFAHKAGWFKKSSGKLSGNNKFKTVDEAKDYFKKLGIDVDFRDVTKEHIPLLNKIRNNIKKLKDLGVKVEKPDTLTISDWRKREEFNELCQKRGAKIEYRPNFFAFIERDKNGANHIFVNSAHKDSNVFVHEMGHANHFGGHDSFWESKSENKYNFAEKQLEILGYDIKILRDTDAFNNIFKFRPNPKETRYAFPSQDMQTKYVHPRGLLSEMQKETNCYDETNIAEQVAYVFDGLVKGKRYSDEVMLYYDFAGGARIPNLVIKGKTYDEYIESLYKKPELIQKLKQNVFISKN